jgi:hypothetical protein
LYKEAERIIGWAQTTLRDLKSIAERYELSLRNDKLSWNHHKEIASLKLIEGDEKGNYLLENPLWIATMPQDASSRVKASGMGILKSGERR